MRVRATDGSNGTTEFHNIKCKHNCEGYTYEIEVEADTFGELRRQLELIVNKDFASDYGMTVEEYISEGLGYKVATTHGYHAFRLFPCFTF